MKMPRTFIIESTNRCNLKCPICHTGSGRNRRKKEDMTLESFKRIVDQISSFAKSLMLYNLGEPLLNPNLFEMIKYASSKKISVSISTNGVLLTKEKSNQIIESGLQELIVCLDGADQETLEKYRVGSDFATLIANIKELCSIKRHLNVKLPRVELQFIVMRHNEHQIQKIREIAKGLDIDRYSEKLVGINRNSPDFQQLAKEFVPVNLTFSRYNLDENGMYSVKGELVNGCRLIEKSVVINVDGSVIPCCYDFDAQYIMGNIFEEEFDKIWLGEKFQSFRKRVAEEKQTIEICRAACSEENMYKRRV